MFGRAATLQACRIAVASARQSSKEAYQQIDPLHGKTSLAKVFTPSQPPGTAAAGADVNTAGLRRYNTTCVVHQNPTTGASGRDSMTAADSDDEQLAPSLELYGSKVRTQTDGVVPGKGPPPSPPTTCCASGCANCVWIDFAEQLKEYYKDGGAQARRAIQTEVEDANLRAFLLLELS